MAIQERMKYSENMTLDSDEWKEMNERRAKLINMQVEIGYVNMHPDDREEYDHLQEISCKIIQREFPSPFI